VVLEMHRDPVRVLPRREFFSHKVYDMYVVWLGGDVEADTCFSRALQNARRRFIGTHVLQKIVAGFRELAGLRFEEGAGCRQIRGNAGPQPWISDSDLQAAHSSLLEPPLGFSVLLRTDSTSSE